MNWFEVIKMFYPKYWTKEMVADAVKLGNITPEQYKQIVGEDYPTATEPEVVEEPETTEGSGLPGAEAPDEPKIEM